MNVPSRSKLSWAASAVFHGALLAGLGSVVTLVARPPSRELGLSLEPTALRYAWSGDEGIPTVPAREAPAVEWEAEAEAATEAETEAEAEAATETEAEAEAATETETEAETETETETATEAEHEASGPQTVGAELASARRHAPPRRSPPETEADAAVPGQPAPAAPHAPSLARRARALAAPPPERPARCARRGHRGTCVLEVEILASGAIGSAKVVESAGCSRLDEAARDAVVGYRFEPARDAGGAACASRERIEVTFR
ncbi:MAG: TonB family protein [Planctomycetes bacterium]|nr:TonB family protein [Planctomycetota bacterium]